MIQVTYPVATRDRLNIVLEGTLCVDSIAGRWKEIISRVDLLQPAVIVVDAAKITCCDGTGIGFLLDVKRRQVARQAVFEIKGLPQEYGKLMDMVGDIRFEQPARKSCFCTKAVSEIGRCAHELWHDWLCQLDFLGKFCVTMSHLLLHPLSIRWKSVFFIAERAGADAVGITCLLGFLIGLILAFQAAIPMMRFGAQVFVANLVAVTLFRELGPLITALVIASRSGSAFAAEIGTMKVNEELDAMKTMGIDPVSFLVVPRVFAAVCVTPLLTIFNIMMGIIGAWIVMLSLDFTTRAFVTQVKAAVNLADMTGGFIKTFIFGCLIAGIGCLRGLQTTSGPTAVGQAATRAVVSSVIAVVIADGIFAVLFYVIGF